MLQFIPAFHDKTIAVRASGKLTHEDYQNFLPKLEAKIKGMDKVPLLLEFDDFIGWELGAVNDDFKFGMAHLDSFERIAMVGDKSWEHWMVLMIKPFILSTKVRYFDREHLQSAWNWLREEQILEASAEQLAPYKNIVVAVDFTAHSKHACKRAFELADFYQSSLTLLNIAHYSTHSITLTLGEDLNEIHVLEDQNNHRVVAAESQMKAFIKSLDTERPLISKVISGNTSSSIVSFLEAQSTDLIVFGTKQKHGLSKFMSSTTSYVQSHSRCEILIVPVNAPVF